MDFEYIDIHSHLNFSQYDSDREALIEKLNAEKIATITVGTGLLTSQEAIALAEKHENLFATVGLHPADDILEKFDTQAFTDLLSHKKVVAIGECGLDYARLSDESSQKRQQKEDFEKQIELAVTHHKPLMIHCREAYEDALALLNTKKKEYGDVLQGNFHFFTSPIDIARQCLELDFTVSFTGPITYTHQYDEVVRFVPLEKMMAETDSPFAAPVPYRGKRNEPLYVTEIVNKIAVIKGVELGIVKTRLLENAFHLFFKNIL